MRPRPKPDPNDPEAARTEIRRLELDARRALICHRRATGGARDACWENWIEARRLLGELADADVPDLTAARAVWEHADAQARKATP